MHYRFLPDHKAHSPIFLLDQFRRSSKLWSFDIRWWFEKKEGVYWDGPRVFGLKPQTLKGTLILGCGVFRTQALALAHWDAMHRAAHQVDSPDTTLFTLLSTNEKETKMGAFITTDRTYGSKLPSRPPAWFIADMQPPSTAYDHLLFDELLVSTRRVGRAMAT